MKIPKSHPRHESLRTRESIARGVEKGITSIHGLIAHGRGEAFDYLMGEKTHDFAKKSAEAAAATLLAAKHPVISVNGNTAALVPKELAELSNIIHAPIEINIFHSSKKREINIKNYLEKHGAKNALLPDKKYKVMHLESNRKYVNRDGILKSDIVFVPLEDGDRTEALIKNNKKVITIDLNPLSRTSQKATVSITDNITRAIPLLINTIRQFKKYNKKRLNKIIKNYNNKKTLDEAIKKIRKL